MAAQTYPLPLAWAWAWACQADLGSVRPACLRRSHELTPSQAAWNLSSSIIPLLLVATGSQPFPTKPKRSGSPPPPPKEHVTPQSTHTGLYKMEANCCVTLTVLWNAKPEVLEISEGVTKRHRRNTVSQLEPLFLSQYFETGKRSDLTREKLFKYLARTQIQIWKQRWKQDIVLSCSERGKHMHIYGKTLRKSVVIHYLI